MLLEVAASSAAGGGVGKQKTVTGTVNHLIHKNDSICPYAPVRARRKSLMNMAIIVVSSSSTSTYLHTQHTCELEKSIAGILHLQVVPACQAVCTSKTQNEQFHLLNVTCLDHTLPSESSLVPILEIDYVSLLDLQGNVYIDDAAAHLPSQSQVPDYLDRLVLNNEQGSAAATVVGIQS